MTFTNMVRLKTGPADRRNMKAEIETFDSRAKVMFKFKNTTIQHNLGDSGPYFHRGSMETLEDVVKYFNRRCKAKDKENFKFPAFIIYQIR